MHADLLDVANELFTPDVPGRRLREIWDPVRGALLEAVKRRRVGFHEIA